MITLRCKLPSLNEVIGAARQNPYKSNQLKREAEKEILLQLPKIRLKGCYDWTFVWLEPTRRRDPDNISSGVKFIFDAMQTKGILDNDGWGSVGSIRHEFRLCKKGEQGVLINYSECDSI